MNDIASSETLGASHGLQIDPDMTVHEIMRKWPQTVAAFLKYRMLYVGCPIGQFHTVANACREHRVSEPEFLADLQAAVCGRR